MIFFEIEMDGDLCIEDQWHLKWPVSASTGQVINSWPLLDGQPIDVDEFRNISFPIQYEGPRTSFNIAGGDIPVVHKSIADVFAAQGGNAVRLLPCLIDGKNLDYFVLVVEKKIALPRLETI